MQVILKKNVDKLGSMGEIKNVSEGYGRNFLLPKGFAMVANKSNLLVLKHEQDKLKKKKEVERDNLKKIIEKLAKTSININVKVGETEKLFGVITKEDITKAIEEQVGIKIHKTDIELENPIKDVGVYLIDAKLRSEQFPDEITEQAKLKIWVVGE